MGLELLLIPALANSSVIKTFIEKVSNATGVLYEPYHIVEMAKANREAALIKDDTRGELEKRAIQRFINQEAQKQKNIERILRQAILEIKEDAKPENMERDWLANFFDKCHLTSDEKMQIIWAKILAGEANAPGSFSKRTVLFMQSLDKREAELFTQLCAFNCKISTSNSPISLIYNVEDDIYKDNGITFIDLEHLDAIGLISFASLAGYRQIFNKGLLLIEYNNSAFSLSFNKETENDFKVGKVLLTNTGRELSLICNPEAITNFENYLTEQWMKQGIEVKKISDAS